MYVGWDGYVYPFTFNAQDFEPITGTVHQPPPIHQTFEIRGYVVCTFAPRFLDTHPEAVKIPWVHDNVEADEVLFYVRGNFRIAARNRTGFDHTTSARHSAWPASRDDHGEQECDAHRRAGGDVRHATHARAHRTSSRARRREISAKLARVVAKPSWLGSVDILRADKTRNSARRSVAPQARCCATNVAAAA